MSLNAPHSNAMRIGQGFNSYTQEIRVEDAVKIKKGGADGIMLPDNPSNNEQPAVTVAQPPKPPTNGIHSPVPTHFRVGVDSAANATHADDPAASTSVFSLPNSPTDKGSQSVTYSTRAIQNVSEIMDALNISTAMSIKYGTIHGNGSASYVNEGKILDSQLNYVISVKVNNNTHVLPDEMEFQPIEDLPPEQFTEAYGDCFISGFLEGGEFNAIISVNVHDKSKARQVKQAIDLQLAVGPSPVSVGAQESTSKDHSELLQDTEITISVNWSGGGDIKKPEVPWTLPTVMAVANAFPSMVARRSSKTSAILTKYTSLRSFQAWRWKKGNEDRKWAAKNLILNYAPCNIYTADLFDALMAYKWLWKRIDPIMQDPTKWKMRESPKRIEPPQATRQSLDQMTAMPNVTATHTSSLSSSAKFIANGTASSTANDVTPVRSVSPQRQNTFGIDDPMVKEDWDINVNNNRRDPIPLDPVSLNEARLLCREAIMLITEEVSRDRSHTSSLSRRLTAYSHAARLVNHPKLAYAEFDGTTGRTRMKKPNYAYFEVLKNRLPMYITNDAADDSHSRDAVAILTRMYAYNDDLFCHIVGGVPNPHRTYKPFTSLALNESHGAREGTLSMRRDSERSIGAIGFRFTDENGTKQADGCTAHYGRPHFDDSSMYKTLNFSHFNSVNKDSNTNRPTTETTRLDICYVPGSGRIAGLVFHDGYGDQMTERLAWKQWCAAGHEPEGLTEVTQEPPQDDQQWRFVGLMGDFDRTMWGDVLAWVSGIWRRV